MNFNDIDYEKLNKLSKEYGDAFYLLDSSLFEANYKNMLNAFRTYYENTIIAYSYKTNYLPNLCRKIDELGGCAEIVSEMEWYLSKKLGIKNENVYYNGPYKKPEVIEDFLLSGGHLNIDAEYEAKIVKAIASKCPEKTFEVGLRCLIDIGQEESSRFGLEVADGTLEKIYDELTKVDNISVVGLHIHLPFRNIDTFMPRMKALKNILDVLPENAVFKYVSLGGGYMGEVDKELAREFTFIPPTYDDYAKVVAGEFSKIFEGKNCKPQLIIEPGSAIVANTMRLVTRVVNIKHSRNRYIATLTGSTYNMNPSVKGVRRTIDVYEADESKDDTREYENLDMAGYTCIEGDYLYHGYKGILNASDFVVFRNVGSYSVVMKPPFILPDIAVIDMANEFSLIKNYQKASDIFDNML